MCWALREAQGTCFEGWELEVMGGPSEHPLALSLSSWGLICRRLGKGIELEVKFKV